MENTQSLIDEEGLRRLREIEAKMKRQAELSKARYVKWLNKDGNRAAMKAYKRQYDLDHKPAKQAKPATA